MVSIKKNRDYNLFSVVLDVVKTSPLYFAVEYIATAVDGVALALIAAATSRLLDRKSVV